MPASPRSLPRPLLAGVAVALACLAAAAALALPVARTPGETARLAAALALAGAGLAAGCAARSRRRDRHDARRTTAHEAALRESEDRFRMIADLAPVGIAFGTPDFRATYNNPRSREILGADPSTLPPERWVTMLHPDDREMVLASSARFMAGEVDRHDIEYRIVREDGEVTWLRDVVRWRRDADGERIGYIAIQDDITRVRTLEARLQHAQKMEAVGKLAGGIAHDFNNLLTVVNGNLHFVRETLGPMHPVQRDLAEISGATTRATTLVRQLLAFGRKQPLHPELVDVNAVVRGAERLLARVLGDEITCHVRSDAHAAWVQVDRTQLEQVLINLALNARDAMLTPRHGTGGNGGVLHLWVDHLLLDEASRAGWSPLAPGPYVRLRVRDTGHGMDAATLARIFEPFFTTKDVGVGTGLGLATVEGIIAQSGGAVRVESQPGRGATFTILLPAAGAPLPSASTDDGAEAIAAGVAKGTILLAEDEEGVRRLAQQVLEQAGYRVLAAPNGEEALRLWRAQPERSAITALVSDVRMPVLGGYALLERLRAEAPTLPAVMMSGHGEAARPSRMESLVFVPKPFAPEALVGALREVTAR